MSEIKRPARGKFKKTLPQMLRTIAINIWLKPRFNKYFVLYICTYTDSKPFNINIKSAFFHSVSSVGLY